MTTIVQLKAENYKRLKAVEITPGKGANLVPITGKNGQGKSSVLDAITAALGGRSYMPKQPVRKGEEEGAIRLELSNGLVVRRIFAEDGTGTIVVENAEGARYPSPQAVLDKLYSSVAFDPIAFTRLKPAEQLETLRRLVKLDVDVDKLAAASKADYEARRELNREAKQWEGQLSGFGDVGEPGEPIPTAEIEAAINSAAEANGHIEQRRVRREQCSAEIERLKKEEERLEQEIAQLQSRLDDTIIQREGLEEVIGAAGPLPEPIDVSALTAKLSEAQTHNRRVERAKEKQALQARVDKLKADADALTKAMEEREAERVKAFQTAKMPVPGLSFGEGEVLFDDLPLDQASTAEQLRISVAIGMATNPELKVMLVRDASLLDEDSYALLAKMAVDGDAQFWVESVDTSGTVGIIMEDGAVKDAPEPEPIDRGKRRAKKESGDDGVGVADASASSAVVGQGEAATPDAASPDTKPDPLEQILEANKDSAPEPTPGPVAQGEEAVVPPPVASPDPTPPARRAPAESLFD